MDSQTPPPRPNDSPPPANPAPSSVSDSIKEFASKLFKVFASRHQTDSKNMCFSPLEVFNSLVMILVGAKGTSEAQLEETLCLRNFNCQAKFQELMDLREWIIKSNHDIMVYGTFIYIDDRVQIQPSYLAKLKDTFEIKPKRVDFSKLEEAVKIMNKDANEITDGVVRNVICLNDLKGDANVRLVISNAIFFRGYWHFKFGDVRKEDFIYSSGSKSMKVDMMSHIGYHRYFRCEELKVHAVSIAYAASEIRMVILLPDEATSEVSNLIDKLSATKMTELFRQLQSRPKSLTELIIPRFALDAHKVSLQRSVKQMGAKSIYDHDAAQLTGICSDRIHLTKLVHKSFILVDERGSHTSSARQEESLFKETLNLSDHALSPVVFKANHPFVFVILDKDTGVICFMGVVADPHEMLEVVNEKDLSREEIQKLLVEDDTDWSSESEGVETDD